MFASCAVATCTGVAAETGEQHRISAPDVAQSSNASSCDRAGFSLATYARALSLTPEIQTPGDDSAMAISGMAAYTFV